MHHAWAGLMYAMIATTRPDIAFAVGVVSRFMSDPGKKHWEAVKGILRYLSGIKYMCICFGKSNSGVLGYTDSDYGGNYDNRRIYFHIVWWCNILDVTFTEMCGIIYH